MRESRVRILRCPAFESSVSISVSSWARPRNELLAQTVAEFHMLRELLQRIRPCHVYMVQSRKYVIVLSFLQRS